MSTTYAVLAPLYEKLGLADFAQQVTPRLIEYAQQNGLLGRNILELGCGTGGSAVWLCENNFNVHGVDSSPEMVQVLTNSLDERTAPLFQFIEQDIRQLENISPVDMVLAFNVLNEIDSLHNLDAVFTSLDNILTSDKWFIFDVHTIEGLTHLSQQHEGLTLDEDGLMIFTQTQYDYERQTHSCRYLVFRQQDTQWDYQQATRVLKAYPVQAVASLLQRRGFRIREIVTPNYETFKLGVSSAQRVIFVTQKQ
jgi:cyclopropane fatty-acyl-phospholipid synthase-like methyltransferase